jgi:hypothetical protein
MNMQHNILLARKPIDERARGAHWCVVDALGLFDRSPRFGLVDHGLALRAAGDSLA